MLTEDKLKVFRKSLRSGVPDGEIRNEMARNGYSEEEIKLVFAPHKPDMRSWYLFFGIVFSVIGIFLFLTRGTLLFFIFSAAMFIQYYLQAKKNK